MCSEKPCSRAPESCQPLFIDALNSAEGHTMPPTKQHGDMFSSRSAEQPFQSACVFEHCCMFTAAAHKPTWNEGSTDRFCSSSHAFSVSHDGSGLGAVKTAVAPASRKRHSAAQQARCTMVGGGQLPFQHRACSESLQCKEQDAADVHVCSPAIRCKQAF